VLTKREIEVLILKKKGFTQIEIASRLKVSQPAVSSFYNNALQKIRDAKETLSKAKEVGLDA
jgi:transcriptional regulator